MGARKSSDRIGLSSVVEVEAITVAGLAHGFSVGQVDPFGAMIDTIWAADVPDVDPQQNALVPHQLKRPPRRGQIPQGIVGSVLQVVGLDIFIVGTLAVSYLLQPLEHMGLKSCSGRLFP